MNDYQPLDLSALCNVGTDFYKSVVPKTGSLTYHGLPFEVSSDVAQCYIGFTGSDSTAVTIPVNATARNLIFAHALLETRLYQNENVGYVIAHYGVHYQNGESIRIPIRERFEIGGVPLTGWGHWPFLALPDIQDNLVSRYEGNWNSAGRGYASTGRELLFVGMGESQAR